MKNALLICYTLCFFSVKAQTGVDKFDLRILKKIEAARTERQTKILRSISDANNYVNIAIPAGLLVGGIIDNNKGMRQNALYVASSTASTAVLNFALKKIFKRPRPFLVHVSLTPVYKPSQYSFPSGHTSSSFSTATALTMAYPKWYVAAPSFIWAGAVGYSRVYLGVHNPSDVAAGAVLGAGTALGLGFIRP
ncbi:undecaprenyl-diphosphatase [Dyadobacter koreensis]|uniref:Undecaprenyl-diphosphatase n=1 Tax=Dyadobacter koreensis TaxID=408657 RepID=A0A1H6QCN5_9BACT|nr:phosphatase PAP2 family protein [Dyadobacter koreensis]SEI37340.1 undecaprenyl-diphosphatase [Dyadobacter koreensis]